MKKIRNKIILIALAIVLLTLLPIGWLVDSLVVQSYQVGVNPQVEEALRLGVENSRDLYRLHKAGLSARLSALPDEVITGLLNGAAGISANLPEPENWLLYGLQILDDRGRVIWAENDSLSANWPVGVDQLAQLADAAGGRMVFSDRERNRFLALERRTLAGRNLVLALAASLHREFLRNSEQGLQVYQLYKTLDLTSLSIPRQLLYLFLTVTMLVLLLTVAIAVWLSRRITRPLGELVTGTQEIGRGNLNYRLEQQSSDEIGELVLHFNRMAEELQGFQERTVYLERMAAWQEVARRLAHEIKNPLTPIQLTMQEMVDQYSGEDAEYAGLLQECREIINEEIDNLRNLVNEFSAFGRLPELNPVALQLNELISDVALLYPHAKLNLLLDKALPELQLDSDRIRRVLINLIENALQSHPETAVDIQTGATGNAVQLLVRDYGPGIPEELLTQVFQPYFSTREHGSGLGLAITRKMVEEHQGSISVNNMPDGGAAFSIRLPLADSEQS